MKILATNGGLEEILSLPGFNIKLKVLSNVIEVGMRENTEDKLYFGDGNLVHENGKYYLKRQLGKQGGGSIIKEITEEDFIGVREGRYTFDSLVNKYIE